ncbi:MAG: invasion associated locus B family protein [Rhizobiaceae bacterium]|nr:invasion associated locus B family protein [Rhizobiaceae bacterium]
MIRFLALVAGTGQAFTFLVALAFAWNPVVASPFGAPGNDLGGAARASVVLAQATPSEGATVTTTTTTHGGWTVSCREAGEMPQKTCSAEFRAVSKQNNNATVLIWLLGRDAKGKLLAEFVTPGDVLIKPGVSVVIGEGGKPSNAEFVSCSTKQGCRASMEVTPKLARDLKQATKVTVGLTLINGQVMQVAMEVTGIDKALADLDA